MVMLRGRLFGNVFCAPGARGFFGEGYPFHQYAKLLGMTWHGTAFAAKTTTFPPRAGQLPLKEDGITPQEFIPKCVVTDFKTGHVLNAVSLSGPGARVLLEAGRWQARLDCFFLSFMSAEQTVVKKLEELVQFVKLLKYHLPSFNGYPALQLNFGCPNTEASHVHELEVIQQTFNIAAALEIPLVANFSPATAPELLAEVATHPQCDGLWIANTIPWGTPEIDWKGLFGSDQSPLVKRGFASTPGGLSGPACLPFTVECIEKLRKLGVKKPIIGGNGVQSVQSVEAVCKAGADGIALGIIGIVRPWRMKQVISVGNHSIDFYSCRGVRRWK